MSRNPPEPGLGGTHRLTIGVPGSSAVTRLSLAFMPRNLWGSQAPLRWLCIAHASSEQGVTATHMSDRSTQIGPIRPTGKSPNEEGRASSQRVSNG